MPPVSLPAEVNNSDILGTVSIQIETGHEVIAITHWAR
jgi:hypothetical protein